jgi:mono/diheme cytochrome c family protein
MNHRINPWPGVLGVLFAIAHGDVRVAAAEDSAALSARFVGEAVPFVKKHCVECHGEKEPKADLNLAADLEPKSLLTRRKVWESVLDMVETGQMPPSEQKKPDPVEVDKFTSLVKAMFDDADRNATPDPGRVTVRRLNRVEYNNTIRDLVGVDFNPAEDFPSDDIGHGFDNIGDVLTLSPVLMERYLAAAEGIVNRAIVPNPPKPSDRGMGSRYLEPAGAGVPDKKWRGISTRRDTNPIVTGPLHTRYMIPDDGEYDFHFNCYAEVTGDAPVQIAILVCGKNVTGGVNDEAASRLSGQAVAGLRPFVIIKTLDVAARSASKPDHFRVRIPPTRGIERVAVAIVKPPLPPSRPADEPADALVPDRADPVITLYVDYFGLQGPLDPRPASHRALLACSPDKSKPDQTREVLTRFVSRAYRRPATPDEIERLVIMTTLAQDDGLSWDEAMQRAFMAVLVSPKFLFRLELDNSPVNTGDGSAPRPIDEFQLASRLSYFLWSTMPDDELMALARRGELTNQLDAQVRRMLADPRSRALVDNFAMQWLQLKRLKTFAPDPRQFQSFNENLRSAMSRETELFFESIIREDRSVLEMIDADYTFLNETLARHYGIADTKGNWIGQKAEREGGQPIPRREFVRVSLPHKLRGGLLTQASILTVTSNPTRTSPVKRGRWVLEQILGAPPPPPPPNVPELVEGEKAQLTGSLRQRMEQHRANPACANCHAKMDPIGFAFENYDAIGAYRTKDGEFPIEPAGVLPDGKAFQGPADLKTILMEKKSQFTRCLTEKLMIYALGRGLEYYDRRPVMQIQEALAKKDFKFSVLVSEIVKSDPFRLRRGKEE